LTLGDFRRIASSGCNFDELGERTGAGQACTSCALDLEYYFVNLPVEHPKHRTQERYSTATNQSVKARIYKWIDSHSPLRSYALKQPGPVLFAPNVEQWLVITNQSLRFDQQKKQPTVDITLAVRDSEGAVQAELTDQIPSGTTWSQNLTALMTNGQPSNPDSYSIGSFELSERWLTPGVRGTARPQIILNSARGSDAVHTVGASAIPERWVAAVNQPSAQRSFISLVNGSNRERAAKISYPHDVEGCAPTEHDLILPARGARLHEVVLPAGVAKIAGMSPFDVRVWCEGRKNVHVIGMDADGSRISIDHI